MQENLETIKKLLRDSGLTLQELADEIDVSYHNLSQALSGSKTIGGTLLTKIGRYFNTVFYVKYPKE